MCAHQTNTPQKNPKKQQTTATKTTKKPIHLGSKFPELSGAQLIAAVISLVIYVIVLTVKTNY